jgi:DNA-dependent protein kinase catalytic subunit
MSTQERLDEVRHHLEKLKASLKYEDGIRTEQGIIALENLGYVRKDIYLEEDLDTLRTATNFVITEKHALISILDSKSPRIDKLIKEKASKELAGWLEVAEKHKLLLDSEDLKHIKKTCIFLLRDSTNSAAMRKSCGESLKLVIKRTVSDLQASQETVVEEDKNLFVALMLDLKKAKATERVKVQGVIMCILGALHSHYANVIGTWVHEKLGKENHNGVQDIFLEYLTNHLHGEKSNELTSGYLEAVLGALTSQTEWTSKSWTIAQTEEMLSTIYSKVCKIVNDNKELKRYKVLVTALELIREHSECFKQDLLSRQPEKMYESLLDLCVHENRDVKTAALEATDSWVGQVSALLQPKHQPQHMNLFWALWNTCNKRMGDDKVRVVCLAMRGFGALAKTAKIAKDDLLPTIWDNLTKNVRFTLTRLHSEDFEDGEAEQLLPDLLVSLADFLLQMSGEVSVAELEMLDNLCEQLLQFYRETLNSRRFLFHRAFYFLLHSLHQCGHAVLSQFLDKAVYRNICNICVRPELDDRYAPPGVSPTDRQKPQPCTHFSGFWGSLGAKHGEWLRKRGMTADVESVHKSIQRQVYTRIWQAVIRIVKTLDFVLDTEQGEAGGEEGNEENNAVLDWGIVFQASGLTGREQPRNRNDWNIALNVVDFVKFLLAEVAPEYFKDSCHIFCETMIKLSSQNVLFSGFFKLLTAAMKSARKGHFFCGLSLQGPRALQLKDNHRNSEGENNAMEVEGSDTEGAFPLVNTELCFVITSKFAKEVLARTEQCFDDLLVAMLELILILPREMRDLELQVPALIQALKHGVSCAYIANVALDSLEEWVDDREERLQGYLCEILPVLELYLLRQEGEDDSSRKGAISIDKQVGKYKYQMKKKSDFSTKESESPHDVRDMALRAVKLLAKLGTDESWLADAAAKQAFDTYNMNTAQSLIPLKKFDFGNEGQKSTPAEHISIDCLLPRVMFLAENSVDRQTKVASCELLHALFTAAIGFHSQSGSTNDKNYVKLFESVFPCVFRLAVDGDTVSNQLFQPLAMQMIHWYTTKPEYLKIAEQLLNAILGGLESNDNGKLRDAASSFLAEFVKWTLKGIITEEEKEKATTVKNLLNRIYGLLNHPSAPKRLGAYLAVKKVIKCNFVSSQN